MRLTAPMHNVIRHIFQGQETSDTKQMVNFYNEDEITYHPASFIHLILAYLYHTSLWCGY